MPDINASLTPTSTTAPVSPVAAPPSTAPLSFNASQGMLSPSNLNYLKGLQSQNVQPAAQETPESSLQSTIAHLTQGQESTPGSGLAQQLYSQLSSLPAADAQKLLASIPSSSTLGTQLANLQNPGAATSASQYGFDPLSLGDLFSTSIAPWLAQQQTANSAATAGLSANLTNALKGASPAIQQAYAAISPSQAAAQNTTNEAISQSVATAPEWDALISGLTNSTNQARLTQAAVQEEPYVAQTTGVGTPPTTGAYAATQQAINQILQSAALPGAQTAPTTG